MKRGRIATMMLRAAAPASIAAVCLLSALPAFGALGDQPAPEEVKGKLSLSVGYRWVTVEGGGEVLSPNEPLDPSPVLQAAYFLPRGESTLGLSLRYDGGSAYGFTGRYQAAGIVDVGVDVVGLPYNIQKVPLPEIRKSETNIRTIDLNPGEEATLDVAEQKVHTYVAAPGYPAVLRLSARRYTTDGQVQQLFRARAGTNRNLVSENRDVSTTTEQVDVGGDVLLGVVSLGYAFAGTHYSDHEPVPSYAYKEGVTPILHNDYPGISSAQHTVELSTSGIGRLEMLASLVAAERTNNDTEITSDLVQGNGFLTWRPATGLRVDLKYGRRTVKDEVGGTGAAKLREANDLPLSRETTQTMYAAMASYQAAKWARVRGELSFGRIDRPDGEAWDLPDTTDTTTWRLAASLKPYAPLTVDLSYKGTAVDNPAHPAFAERESEGTVSARWQAAKTLSAQALVKGIAGENDESGHKAGRLLADACLSWNPAPGAGFGIGVSWTRDHVTGEVEFGESGKFVDDEVPYTARTAQLYLNGSFKATERLSLAASAGVLRSVGSYELDIADFEDVGSYVDIDDTRQEYSVEAGYDIGSGWSVTCRTAYARNVGDGDGRDEELGEVSAVFSKAW